MSWLFEMFKVGEAHLFSPILMIAIIFVVTVLGLFLGCKNAHSLRRRKKDVEKLRKSKSVTFNEVIKDTGSRRNATSAKVHTEISEITRLTSKSKSTSEIGEAVSLLAAKDSAGFASSFLGFAVGVVLILGLAGTFMAFFELVSRSGIGTSLSEPGEVVSGVGTADEGSSLESSIPFIVRHLNLAFIASIAGVMGSVVLQFINSLFVRRYRSSYLIALEQLLRDCFRNEHQGEGEGSDVEVADEAEGKDDLSAVMSEAGKSIKESAASLKEVADRLKDIGKSTPEALGETLDSIKSELERSPARYEELVKAARQTHGVVENLAGLAGDSIEEAVSRFSEKQTETLQQLESYKNELLKTIAENDKVRQDQFEDQLAKVVGSFVTLGDEVRNSVDKIIAAFIGDRTEFFMKIEGFGNELEESADKLIEAFRGDRREFFSEMDKGRATTEEVIKGAAEAALKEMRVGYESQKNEWREISNLAKEQKLETSKMLKEFKLQREEVTVQVSELLKGATEATRVCAEGVSHLEKTFLEANRQLKGVEEVVGDAGGLVKAAESAFMEISVSTKSDLKKAGGTVVESMNAFAGGLRSLSERVDMLIEAAEKMKLMPKKSVKRRLLRWAFWRKDE